MAWTTPITSNSPADKVTVTTFDKIGANQVYLKGRADIVDDRLGQSLNTSDSPTFENVSLSGMTGTVEGRIETNDSDITSLEDRATSLEDRATSLEGKVGQSLNTNSSVTFNSVTTDNVAIKHKLLTGTLSVVGQLVVSHGLVQTKILSVSVIVSYAFHLYDLSISSTKISSPENATIASASYRALIIYEA